MNSDAHIPAPGPARFDSTADTQRHRGEVRRRLLQIVGDLTKRAWAHDASKLEAPEKPLFDHWTPMLGRTQYSADPESPYQRCLSGMGPALQHHYEVNDHHPEHFAGGISDMNLIQVIEMLADWAAAVMRQPNGDLRRSIEQNAERFGYGDEMKHLLLSTADYLGWL